MAVAPESSFRKALSVCMRVADNMAAVIGRLREALL